MKRIIFLATTGFILSLSQTFAIAGPRCPASDSNCTLEDAPKRIQERVNQGEKNVRETSGAVAKVKEVKKTISDCIKCGMEGVSDGVGRVNSKKKPDTSMD
jgi:hypothetical protein